MSHRLPEGPAHILSGLEVVCLATPDSFTTYTYIYIYMRIHFYMSLGYRDKHIHTYRRSPPLVGHMKHPPLRSDNYVPIKPRTRKL